MGSDYFPLNFKGAKLCNQQFPMQKCYPNPQELEIKPYHNTGKTKISLEILRRDALSPHRVLTPGVSILCSAAPTCKAMSFLSSPPATFPAEHSDRFSPIPHLYFGDSFYVPTGLPNLSAEKLPHGPEPPHRSSREGRARLLTGFPAPHTSSLPQAPPCVATGHLLRNKT